MFVLPPFGSEIFVRRSCGCCPLPLKLAYSLDCIEPLVHVVMYAGNVYAVLVAQPLPVLSHTAWYVPISSPHPPVFWYERTKSGRPSPLRSMKRSPRSRYVLGVEVLAKRVETPIVHRGSVVVAQPIPVFK